MPTKTPDAGLGGFYIDVEKTSMRGSFVWSNDGRDENQAGVAARESKLKF